MGALMLIARLLFGPDPVTTDDVWDCWLEEGGSVEVCERVIMPCHYNVSAAECTIVVKRVRLDDSWCDLEDPLACLPEA